MLETPWGLCTAARASPRRRSGQVDHDVESPDHPYRQRGRRVVGSNNSYRSPVFHDTLATPKPAAVLRSFLVSPSAIICTVSLP